jgi:hypothetical protein
MSLLKIERFDVIGLIVLLVLFCGGPASARDTVPGFLKPDKPEDPLTFEGIDVLGRSEDTIVLRWTTNHPARGRLQYGYQNLDNQRLRANSDTSHQVLLDGLENGTTYQMKVYSWDNAENRIQSQVIRVRTRGTPPPRFRGIQFQNKTMTGGTLQWATNVPTTAVLRVGHDTPLRYRSHRDTPTRIHEVELDHFRPGKHLHYRITVRDTRGRVQETRLRSTLLPEANVARNKPVTGTFDRPIYGLSTDQQGEAPLIERVTDDRFGYQYGTSLSGDPADTMQQVTIDLKQLYTPDTVVLFWWTNAYPERYRITASKLKRNWDVLADELNAGNGDKVQPGGLPSIRQIIRPGKNASYRYIRIEIPKGSPYYTKYDEHNFVGLVELKVFPRDTFRYIQPYDDQWTQSKFKPMNRKRLARRIHRNVYPYGSIPPLMDHPIHENGEEVMQTRLGAGDAR